MLKMDEDAPTDDPNEDFGLDVSDIDYLENIDDTSASEEADPGSLDQTALKDADVLLNEPVEKIDAQSELSEVSKHAKVQSEQNALDKAFASKELQTESLMNLNQRIQENTNDNADAAELDDELVTGVSEFLERIALDPLDYDAHVELISLYRKAELYHDLRSARQTMHAFHPLSETLWLQWLDDEISGALLLEDKISVVRLYEQSTRDYLSFRLWKDYSEYVVSQYRASMEDDEDEELKNFFSSNMVLDVLQAAIEATKYILPTSHEIWVVYRDFLQSCLEDDQSESMFVLLKRAYEDHIATPHSFIDLTWEDYSSFVSSYDSTNYEATMMSATVTYQAAKAIFEARERFELQLTPENILDYLEWEGSQEPLDFELLLCLYERALTVYPLTSSLWFEYTAVLIESQRPVLQVIERAVRNCPDSGILWACYFRLLEMDGRQLEDILETKARALNSHLRKNFADLVEVHGAWYEALWRKNHAPGIVWSEELNLSLLGTSDEIESIAQSLGEAFKVTDPQYRLERLCINFKTFCDDLDGARKLWKRLSKRHYHEVDFWVQFFNWERNYGTFNNARKTLLDLSYQELDCPERLYNTLLSFERELGDAKSLQTAFTKLFRAQSYLQKNDQSSKNPVRNTIETIQTKPADQELHAHEGVEKRKPNRSDRSANKKVKLDHSGGEEALQEVGRDRENASVRIQYLPLSTSEKRLKQVFRDCGCIILVRMFAQEESQTAIIEFQNAADVRVALTRDKKVVDGAEIHVTSAKGLRLFVTNFAATADEASIYEMFSKYGEVVAVDFPSLKYNNKRRFCYVGFKSTEQSYAALELDGTVVEGHEIKVHISDPTNRAARTGAIYEGRQLIVTNLPFSMKEDDIKPIFESYGEVASIRIIKFPDGTSKGFGFVSYTSREAAQAALSFDGADVEGRALSIKIAEVKVKSKRPITHRVMNQATPEASVQADLPTHEDIVQRTVCAINVADTVNETRIRHLFEPFGSLRKVELRPSHSGAIIEYESAANAGKALLALEGRELAGQQLHFVSFGEVKLHAPSSVKVAEGAADKTSVGARSLMPQQVNRMARRKALGISGAIHKT